MADTARMERELRELRAVLRQHPELYKKYYLTECVTALKRTVLFGDMPDETLMTLAKRMTRHTFPEGTLLTRQQIDVADAFVIAEGEVRRWVNGEGDRLQVVQTFCPNSVGTLHLYNVAAESRFNAECVTDVVAYSIHRTDLDQLIATTPAMSQHIIRALSGYIRSRSSMYATPLLEQKAVKTSITATTLAATCESFYRSGMNALINARISGKPVGRFFPDMHIQTPVRVVYINGIKQIRVLLSDVDTHQYQRPDVVRMLLSFVPGVIMCPFSSVLEAANAKDKNPEPLARRWTRGFAPRLVREVVFGIGMNQLADFCTERATFVENAHLKGWLGSCTAGVLAGYLSHVPHNLSAMKLFSPEKTYGELWKELYSRSIVHVPAWTPPAAVPHMAKVYAVLFPIGVVRRSVQIGGTFVIINGITFSFRHKNWY